MYATIRHCERGVASTARAAIDAMRRGVVEYTTLTD